MRSMIDKDSVEELKKDLVSSKQRRRCKLRDDTSILLISTFLVISVVSMIYFSIFVFTLRSMHQFRISDRCNISLHSLFNFLSLYIAKQLI